MENQTTQTSKWTGSVLGLIGTWLVTMLLISVTLGIGTPWAIAHLIRYIENNMVVNGHRLSFNGTGGQLIGNWIKWMLLSLITIGIYSLWIPNNVFKWVTLHTHMEG